MLARASVAGFTTDANFQKVSTFETLAHFLDSEAQGRGNVARCFLCGAKKARLVGERVHESDRIGHL